MDWKYKHFRQERVFPASRDVVTEAARAYMAESLGWKTMDVSALILLVGVWIVWRRLKKKRYRIG
ncbi:MAG TPA: hypothetical protein VGJ69_11185 [Pyrinomonadaceae bacterium]